MEPLCSGHLLPFTFLAQRVSEPHGCFRCHLYNELFWIKCCCWVPGRPASVVLDIFLTDETVNEVFRDFTNKANSAPERHSRHKWRTRRCFSRLPNTSNYQSWNCRMCQLWICFQEIDWLVFMSVSRFLRPVNFLPILLFYETEELFCLWRARLTLLLLK